MVHSSHSSVVLEESCKLNAPKTRLGPSSLVCVPLFCRMRENHEVQLFLSNVRRQLAMAETSTRHLGSPDFESLFKQPFQRLAT